MQNSIESQPSLLKTVVESVLGCLGQMYGSTERTMVSIPTQPRQSIWCYPSGYLFISLGWYPYHLPTDIGQYCKLRSRYV